MGKCIRYFSLHLLQNEVYTNWEKYLEWCFVGIPLTELSVNIILCSSCLSMCKCTKPPTTETECNRGITPLNRWERKSHAHFLINSKYSFVAVARCVISQCTQHKATAFTVRASNGKFQDLMRPHVYGVFQDYKYRFCFAFELRQKRTQLKCICRRWMWRNGETGETNPLFWWRRIANLCGIEARARRAENICDTCTMRDCVCVCICAVQCMYEFAIKP